MANLNVFAALVMTVVLVVVGGFCWKSLWSSLSMACWYAEKVSKEVVAKTVNDAVIKNWRKEARFNRLMAYLTVGGLSVGMFGSIAFFMAFVKALALLLP